MGKLLFVDLDDCIVESSPLIQKAFDEKTSFKNKTLETLEYTMKSCLETYVKNKLEVVRAIFSREKPKLIGNVKVGSNDVMKTTFVDSILTDSEKRERRFYRWYIKPLDISKQAYEEAKKNWDNFLEERDHFLEQDNQSSIGDAIVDYRNIYNSEHLTPGAVNMINETIDSGEYEGCYCLSHHNGGREEYCKQLFIASITNGKLPLVGLRFHAEEYSGKRRQRSSKALHVMKKFNLSSLKGCVLIDDSVENLNDWVKYGGMAVLYRPMSEDEKYDGKLEPHGDEYPRITKMDKAELDEALKFYKNSERVLKKGVR